MDIPSSEYDTVFIYVVIPLILLAHFAHLIFYEPESFINNPRRIIEIGQGLASHGGITGAILGLYIFCRRYKKNFFAGLDYIGLSGFLGGAFIRIGNFLILKLLENLLTCLGLLFFRE